MTALARLFFHPCPFIPYVLLCEISDYKASLTMTSFGAWCFYYPCSPFNSILAGVTVHPTTPFCRDLLSMMGGNNESKHHKYSKVNFIFSVNQPYYADMGDFPIYVYSSILVRHTDAVAQPSV